MKSSGARPLNIGVRMNTAPTEPCVGSALAPDLFVARQPVHRKRRPYTRLHRYGLKQRLLSAAQYLHSNRGIAFVGQGSPLRCALEITLLDEKGLVHFLERL